MARTSPEVLQKQLAQHRVDQQKVGRTDCFLNPNGDASNLSADDLKAYLQLVSDGSPRAVADAGSLHANAIRDADDIRQCREALQLLSDAEKPAARRKHGQLQDKLDSLREEISRLSEVAIDLEQQVAKSEIDIPYPPQFRKRARMIATNFVVRQALGIELEAAGC